MKKIVILFLVVLTFTACTKMEKEDIGSKKEEKRIVTEEPNENNQGEEGVDIDEIELIINEEGLTIGERINEPKGFSRIELEEGSFKSYLRNISLKPHLSQVLYYDGKTKKNPGVYEAVVNMDIGTKDLQQCADAIMRLRGEYLYNRGEYDKIHFNLTNGFRVDYTKWAEGYRVMVDGNKTYWRKRTQKSNSYEDFRKYMEFVFTYAGTLSLEQELQPIELAEMQIGDIFIQGGSPGHAVIVVDMAENEETGEKLYILAQSYMPAQDIQILANPNNKDISPWYVLKKDEKIVTPEWTFTKDDLMRFYD